MKKILGIILIIIYISFIVYLIYYNSNLDFALFGTNTVVTYKNNEIKRIKRIDDFDKRWNYEKFYIYDDSNNFNEYYINFYKEENLSYYNLYNNTYEMTYLDKNLLAYHGNVTLQVADVQKSSIIQESDETLISQELSKKGILGEILNYNKIIVDIDKDNIDEIIYSVNNYGTIEDSKIFCYNFMVKSDETVIDIDFIESNQEDILSVENKMFAWAVDLDSDDNYEIVLSNTIGDDSPLYFDFYKYNGKAFSKMSED